MVEASLETHDIAFSCGSRNSSDDMFRLLLVTAAEVDDAVTRERIDRLHHLNGGRRVAVVLLLEQGKNWSALNRLQVGFVHASPTRFLLFSSDLSKFAKPRQCAYHPPFDIDGAASVLGRLEETE